MAGGDDSDDHFSGSSSNMSNTNVSEINIDLNESYMGGHEAHKKSKPIKGVRYMMFNILMCIALCIVVMFNAKYGPSAEDISRAIE